MVRAEGRSGAGALVAFGNAVLSGGVLFSRFQSKSMKHTVDIAEVESGWMALRGHDARRRMVKATLVVSDERVFTESEVLAMLQSAMLQVAYIETEVRLLAHFKAFGLDLDPS